MWCCLALAGALPCISASLAHKGCRHSVHPNLAPPLSPAKRRSESSWQPFPVTPHWPLLITVPPHTAFDSQVQPRATALSLLSPASEHWSETGAIHFPLAPTLTPTLLATRVVRGRMWPSSQPGPAVLFLSHGERGQGFRQTLGPPGPALRPRQW